MVNEQKNTFQDPLENYDPPQYADPLEEALHERTVSSLQTTPITSVNAASTVGETMKLMAGHQIACVLVEEDGKLVGVFSDRDVLDRVALEFGEVSGRPVRDFMTPDPVYVLATDSLARVMVIMAGSGYRHVPVVDADRKPIGIVSPQRMASQLTEYLKSQ
ncbi:MAG: CBS domain-containing protein [Planctomycetaceae bacterium]|nr:CBS domain-containing protein [Planctomycetaceae bacterium]